MFQSRLFLLSATLLLLTPIFVQSDPVDNRKNEVVVKKGAKEVDPKGFLGDSAAAKVADPQHVNIKYGGSGKGPLKGKSGVAGADRAPDNAILTATESSGSKAKVNDDKSKKTADISTSGNDNIKTNVADPKNAVADVKTGKNKNAK